MISIIKNGYLARKKQVVIPYSNFKREIAKVLIGEGYLEKMETKDDGGKKGLLITLKYKGKKPVLREIRIVSKPGLRVYQKVKESQKVLGGLGKKVISTTAGVMTGEQAYQKKLGGEVVLEVY
jgi:small subunit ribosomal protein S8